MKNPKNERYRRQVGLPEIGESGQEKLRAAKVLIAGAGGLGSPLALYLAGAGIGTIGLADDDVVARANLHRQILYDEAQIGLPKVHFAAARLRALNSEVDVRAFPLRITSENARELVAQFDIVADACDNFATRYLLSDTCAALGKPYVYGAVRGFEGQVCVFCVGKNPKTYRDLFPDEAGMLAMPHPGKAVIGMAPAVVGAIQAAEVVRLVVGCGKPLAGILRTFDLLSAESRTVAL